MSAAQPHPRMTEKPNSCVTLPSLIRKEGITKTIVKENLAGNIAVATVIGEFIETTFGPRGTKKIITNVRDVTGWAPDATYITSDGAIILNEMHFKHPIGKIITDTARAIEGEIGGGVKTTIILLSKILEKAQLLIAEGLHPRTIIEGYQKACKKTLEILDQVVISVDATDENLLKNVAMTAMSSKLPSDSLGYIADIVVKAVNYVVQQWRGKEKRLNIDNVKIEKQEGGSIMGSRFIAGLSVSDPMIHAHMPRRIENSKIALITRPIEAVSMGKYSKWGDSVKITITKKEQMDTFIEEERNIARKMAEKIASSGANVVISNWNIADDALSLFARAGILACKRVLMPDLSKIQKAVGGRFVENLDELSSETLGTSKLVLVEKLLDKEYLFFVGCQNPKAVSIMLHGLKFTVDEAERAVCDALRAIEQLYKEPEVVAGGGCFEAQVALQLRQYSKEIGTREQLAIEAFAEAFEELCRVLSKNAGLNPTDALVEIRKRHAEGEKWAGIDATRRAVSNMKDLGVYEPKRIKLHAIKSACETANMILRIDGIISAKPQKKERTLTEDDVEKLEMSMVPKVMEATKPEYKFPWEKGLQT